MNIVELFESIQGEGIWLGMPSLFIRFAGCNLNCCWCDTPRARAMDAGTDYPVEALLARALQSSLRAVVITGGEPTLHAEELVQLCDSLKAAGKRITLETNATAFVPCRADLISMSPKLPGSQADGRTDMWCEEILRQYCESGTSVQVKLVVGSEEEARQALRAIKPLAMPPERIFLMPEARTRSEHNAQSAWLVPLCLNAGVRFGARLQTLLWDNEPGK